MPKSEGQSPIIEFKKKQRGMMVIQLENEEEKIPESAKILFNGEPLLTEESKILRQTSMKNPET